MIEPAGDVSDHPAAGDHPAGSARGFPPPTDSPRSRWWRIPMLLVLVGFAAFWIWALFFASKEAVNKIDDRDWAARAELICQDAEAERLQLTDLTEIDPDDPAMRAELLALADNLDRATDILEEMLNDIVSLPPNDPKGADIVPLWEADYRTYIRDRRRFADNVRQGEIDSFAETAVDGIPISERIATFAGDNEMSTCSPPFDMPTWG